MTPAPQPDSQTSAALPTRPDRLGIFLRVALFALLGWLGIVLFPIFMMPVAGVLVTSVMSVFAAAVVANATVVRIYERGHLSDLGLAWTQASPREFLAGAGAGIGAASAILAGPLLLGLAKFEPAPPVEHPWASFVFVTVVLLFGAVGEEMLFHGYAFQLLIRSAGAFTVILPAGILFGLAHLGNQNASSLGIVNTMAWGVLLGYAYLRTGALWMSIGLHFGWNFTLPLFGVNLSGFTMEVTGYELHWRNAGELWSGGAYGPEGSLLTTMIVAALFAIVPRLTPQRS